MMKEASKPFECTRKYVIDSNEKLYKTSKEERIYINKTKLSDLSTKKLMRAGENVKSNMSDTVNRNGIVIYSGDIHRRCSCFFILKTVISDKNFS